MCHGKRKAARERERERERLRERERDREKEKRNLGKKNRACESLWDAKRGAPRE